MALMDYIQTAVEKVLRPQRRRGGIPAPVSSGKGMGEFEDDMIVSKPAVIFHTSQIFFNFIALCCFASVASFQSKWGVGPSGLTAFALFITIVGILLSLFMMLVPVADVKYGKLTRLSRVLAEERVGFILTGSGTAVSLLIAFIITISAWTEPGCKNPDNDPNASKGDAFKSGLSGWCTTKKAGAIFLWFAFGFWLASLALNLMNWRNGKTSRPRDPPFNPPMGMGGPGGEEGPEDYEVVDHEDEDNGPGPYNPPQRRDTSNLPNSPFNDANAAGAGRPYSGYSAGGSSYSAPQIPPLSGMGSASSIPASRPSMDAYGAFSDPAPSGFGAASGLAGATSPTGVSRTMQYADPYAAVRASIAGSAPSSTPGTPSRQPPPPGYDYSGYR